MGKIYILTNALMPNLVKVGKTSHDAEARAKELSSTTGVPTNFEVYKDYDFSDEDGAERIIHQKLGERYRRVNSKREFFECSPEEADAIILSMAGTQPMVGPKVISEGRFGQRSATGLNAFNRFINCSFTFASMEFEEYLLNSSHLFNRKSIIHIYAGYVASSLKAKREFYADLEFERNSELSQKFFAELTRLLNFHGNISAAECKQWYFATRKKSLDGANLFFSFRSEPEEKSPSSGAHRTFKSIDNANGDLSDYEYVGKNSKRLVEKLQKLKLRTGQE